VQVDEHMLATPKAVDGDSQSDPIPIAVIGCGEIAQIMHLPYLAELPALQIAAVCDVSPTLLEHVGDRYHVTNRSTDFTQLLDDVAAVAILTHDHADIAVEAARRGKDIFVEKPLSFSLEDCDRILAAVEASGVTLMVGYMRRFDPGYEHAISLLDRIGRIRYVRVHDFGGSFNVHPNFYTLYRFAAEATIVEEGRKRLRESMLVALGIGNEQLVDVYYETLMSGIHNLAMLRGMLGQPERVLSSERLGANGLLSVLDYGSGLLCSFEQLLMEEHTWWDQSIAVYGDAGVVTVDLPNPYIRNVPTRVRYERSEDGLPLSFETPVSYDSPFRREWMHFVECIRDHRAPLTGGDDARADVAIALDMVRAITEAKK
jgi:predicted dehydrogenase